MEVCKEYEVGGCGKGVGVARAVATTHASRQPPHQPEFTSHTHPIHIGYSDQYYKGKQSPRR